MIGSARGWAVALSAIVFGTAPAAAQEFALSASPPRFELSTTPGTTVRDVVELDNVSALPATFTMATADWTLTPAGGVVLSSALQPTSCRPWVAIERHAVVLPGKSKLRYRFEVTPPPATPPSECRFAIVISGADEHVASHDGPSFPVQAQIALIVYVEVGDVKPDISIVGASVATIDGVQTPVLSVHNQGTAHGRLAVQLSGVDAKGKKCDFAASTLPILPGTTQTIALTVDQGDATAAIVDPHRPAPPPKPDPIAFPLHIAGTINDSRKSFKFDGSFSP
jgi:hypothetical protein